MDSRDSRIIGAIHDAEAEIDRSQCNILSLSEIVGKVLLWESNSQKKS